MTKRLVILLLIFLSAAVGILFTILSFTKLPNKENNGFTRVWSNNSEEGPIHQGVINPLVTTICGATNSHLFFAGNDPRWIIMTNYQLQPVDSFFYGVDLTDKLRAPGITVDSPNIYMYAAEISFFLNGQVEQQTMDTTRLHTDLITRFAQISPEKLVIRGIDSTQTKQVFKIINCITGEVTREIDLIENQQFGGFDSDGYLTFDKKYKRIFYLQMFQNKLLCLDSNLNLLYSTTTIDTNHANKAKIELVTNDGETKIMSTKARGLVNKEMATGNDFIFVLSGLRADNETIQNFNKHTPIDLYSIKDGKYSGSFYIPNLNQTRAKKIMVLDQSQKILVLYPTGLAAIYDIPIQFRKK